MNNLWFNQKHKIITTAIYLILFPLALMEIISFISKDAQAQSSVPALERIARELTEIKQEMKKGNAQCGSCCCSR